MPGPLHRYVRWLHTQWPAGRVEKLPDVREDGTTNVPGLYVVGDLTGIPLLKFSSDTGARAVRTILAEPSFRSRATDDPEVLDLVVIGAGVSGVAAMAEARAAGLRAELLEATEPLSTVVNFPKGKPIYTYPTDMEPAGELQFGAESDVKEGLVGMLRAFMAERGIEPRLARVDGIRRRGGVLEVSLADGATLRAHRVIVGIGRSGNFRKLGVPGEDLDKVYNRLHDPKDFCGTRALVVGGGDSAMETAIALAQCGAEVTVSYRKPEFSRPKPDNVEALARLAADPEADVAVEEPSSERVTTAVGGFMDEHRQRGSIRLMMSSKVRSIGESEVVVANADGEDETLPNDVVFSMIGREPPLAFFRKAGVHIRGEWRATTYATFALFLLFCAFLYHWKSNAGFGLKGVFESNGWFPFNVVRLDDPANLAGTISISMRDPSFYYTLAYSLCILIFGIKRIRRRRTPYVTVQTTVLTLVQWIPLFLLPFIVLPWLGHNGAFDAGVGRSVADALFPAASYAEHGREYWRAVGFILAWPLMIWNVFTNEPLWAWLIISVVQTFVIIPLIIWRWGKGAYCGWICSCGALAETMGDAHRHKMPHGPVWNRVNMLGQVFLLFAFVLLALRLGSWLLPGPAGDALGRAFTLGLGGGEGAFASYAWFVDLLFAGILGVALYFWFSGRVWCRFACPLAALMHVYARFTQFRILADKSKCISCNICTSVCHQGIDIMNFANKGLPMEDPECVRCSACVQSCPTGVLEFGRIDPRSGRELGRDRLGASPVRMAELTVNGARPAARATKGAA